VRLDRWAAVETERRITAQVGPIKILSLCDIPKKLEVEMKEKDEAKKRRQESQREMESPSRLEKTEDISFSFSLWQLLQKSLHDVLLWKDHPFHSRSLAGMLLQVSIYTYLFHLSQPGSQEYIRID
ncbi:hypothetical protein EVAR_101090_1, partial [Eumeta japonica]